MIVSRDQEELDCSPKTEHLTSRKSLHQNLFRSKVQPEKLVYVEQAVFSKQAKEVAQTGKSGNLMQHNKLLLQTAPLGSENSNQIASASGKGFTMEAIEDQDDVVQLYWSSFEPPSMLKCLNNS